MQRTRPGPRVFPEAASVVLRITLLDEAAVVSQVTLGLSE